MQRFASNFFRSEIIIYCDDGTKEKRLIVLQANGKYDFPSFSIYLQMEISKHEKSYFDPTFRISFCKSPFDTKTISTQTIGQILNNYLIAFGNRYYTQFPLNYASTHHRIHWLCLCVFSFWLSWVGLLQLWTNCRIRAVYGKWATCFSGLQ